MKKVLCMLLLALLLTGCSEEVYETMGNVEHVGQTQIQPRQTVLTFPQDAAVLTAADGDILYTCAGYTLGLQTLPAGDLPSTIRTVSGFDMTNLTLLESCCGDHKRYDWVWVAAGERGDVLCRAAVLDDGNYHYSLFVSADAELAGELTETWNALFSSFCLAQKESA